MVNYQAQLQEEIAEVEKYKKSLKSKLDWLALKFVKLVLSVSKHFYKKEWLITQNRAGDYFYSLHHFIKYVERFPTRDSYNGYYFYLKINNGLLDPVRQFVSDKEHVKTYIRAKVGDKYNVPVIKILRSKEEIDDYVFPDRCCIKPTHSSGHVILRRNGEDIDKEKIKSWFDENFYNVSREVNYRYLKPKVIVEEFVLENRIVGEFKILCYKGAPRIICLTMVDEHGVAYEVHCYDCEWNDIGCSVRFPRVTTEQIEKPENLSEILEIAEKLCEDFESIRVDLYVHDGKVFVGELTNCSLGAVNIFYPEGAENLIAKIFFKE